MCWTARRMIQIETEKYELKKGEFLLVNANKRHSTGGDGGGTSDRRIPDQFYEAGGIPRNEPDFVLV